MVTAVAALVGLLIGSVINWASDVLPRFAGRPDHPALRIQISIVTAPLSLASGVEALTALVFVLVWAKTLPFFQAFAICTAFALLLLITVTDIKHRIIPNVVIYPLLIVVVALALGNSILTHADVRPMLVGGTLSFGMFALTRRLKPGSLGGGDVKLAALIGFVFGFPQVLWALIVGVGSGGVMAGWLLMSRRGGRTTRIPYAPFLCFGAMIALLYNPITWTMR